MERQQHHQVQESHHNGTSSASSSSCWSSYQVQNFAESNHNPHYHHFNGGPGYGSAHHAPHSGRKRGWHHHHHHHPPPGYDYLESINHAKLYVSQVPRTATEPDIRPLFEQYGNIIEVVMLKDKRTGLQQGNCFVKYSTTLEADRAIAALNNQHIFPGELVPISVKYADSEKERLGVRDKVFVAMINKEASLKEIEEIFSPYGYIEDIFIVRDEMKQSRGCGFVRFSQVDMAIAAIKALNGTYTMRGCDHPLAVRFAEPKKPRSGDSRCNNTFNGMNFGPHYHEPVARPTTNPGDSLPGHNRPNAPHFMQHLSSTSQQQVVSSVANQEPLLLSQIPVQQMRNSETSYQSLQVVVPDTQKQAHLIQQSKQISEQQEWSQASGQPRPPSRSSPQAIGSNSTSSTAPVNTQIPEFSECDWSEHACPDGYKYYYNCVTCESMWEKPKEFALFEEQVKKQVQEQNPCHQLQTCSPVLSTQQPAQPQEIQNQSHVLDQKLQLEKQSLSASWEKPKEFTLFDEQVKKQVEEQNPCHQLQSRPPVLLTQQPAQPLEIQNQTDVFDQKLQLEEQSLTAPSEKPKKFALLEEQVKKQVQELNPCHLLQSCSPVLSTQQPAQPQEIQNQTHVLDQKLQPEKQSLSALSEKPKEFALLGEEVNKQVEEQNPCHQLQSCSPMLSTQQPAQPPKIQNHTHVLDQKLQLEKQSLSAPPKEFASLEEQVKKQVEEQNPCHELQSSSPVLSTQQPAQPPEIQNQTLFLDQKLQLEKQSLSAPEPDRMEVQ